MSRTDEVFKPALNGRKIPVLTLDNKWHQLFTKEEPYSQLYSIDNKFIRKTLIRTGLIEEGFIPEKY